MFFVQHVCFIQPVPLMMPIGRNTCPAQEKRICETGNQEFIITSTRVRIVTS